MCDIKRCPVKYVNADARNCLEMRLHKINLMEGNTFTQLYVKLNSLNIQRHKTISPSSLC